MTSTVTPQSTAALRQGDVRLLETDLARQLLQASIPARLALVWTDGTPRVIPTWFHWDGQEIVMVTYTAGPLIGIRHPATRLDALRVNPQVALTIDTDSNPPQGLSIRGQARISEVDGIATEYAAAARRYLGQAGAAELLAAVDQPGTRQARITVRPGWVGLLDFVSRMPSAQGGV
jgi:nitroimidazol reductase NimA-like FMN-containing flavoprotein (pyridoxamine 5'-phosphate oxidase superfamily)